MYSVNHKQVTAALIALLCLGTAVSCGSADSAQEPSAKTDAVTETETVVTEDPLRAQYADIAPIPEDTNGYAFRVTVDQNSVLVNNQGQWDPEEENGDTINDAISP